jgi:hypothetical protein
MPGIVQLFSFDFLLLRCYELRYLLVQVTNSLCKYWVSPSLMDCSDTQALVFDRNCSLKCLIVGCISRETSFNVSPSEEFDTQGTKSQYVVFAAIISINLR